MGTYNGRVLVIAGSARCGGAGLEADQRVLALHGCYAATATTALTAQNTLGVVDIQYTPSAFVEKQIETTLSDIRIDIIKIGMLASRETVEAVANTLRQHRTISTVVDPVMISTSGSQLLARDAISALREQILPLVTILCPNVPEAMLLLSDSGASMKDPRSVDDLVGLAEAVRALGPKYVLMKGGHLPLERNGKLAASVEEGKIRIRLKMNCQSIL